MKKFFIARVLTGLAMLAGVSCSNEAPVDEEQNVLQIGDPTFATFSVYFNTPGTRADDADVNADPVEQTISEINFYIFSGGVLERQVNIVRHNNHAEPIPVAVSTGTKTIYAVTTGILETVSGIEEKTTTASEFEQLLMSAIADDRTAGAFNIAESGKFVMIGKVSRVYITKCTMEEAAEENAVKIGVDRAAAKVQVVYPDDSSATKTVNSLVTVAASVNANFSNAYYDVAQSIKQMRLYANLNQADKTKSITSPVGEKVSESGTYSGFNDVTAESMRFISAPRAANPLYETNRYTGEVIVEKPVSGNSPFAVVKLTCVPNAVYGGKVLTDGTFYVIAHHYKQTSTWSFISGADRNLLYFATAADASEYMAGNDIDSKTYRVYEYTNGTVYYRVDLVHDMDLNDGDTELHRVIRNNLYRAKVTKIDALGSPTVEDLVPGDPDTPIEKDSYLSAEISVLPWTAHDWDVSLE